MKSTGALTVATVVVVLSSLVGVVWFDVPKAQRVARSGKLHELREPYAPPSSSKSAQAPKIEQSTPQLSPPVARAPQVVDLRSSPAASAVEPCESESAGTGATADECDGAELSPQTSEASQPASPTALEAPPAAAPRKPFVSLVLRGPGGERPQSGLVRARWQERGEWRECVAAADADGNVEFHAALGDGVTFQARAAACAPASFGPLSAGQCAGAQLGLTLAAGALLNGRVVAEPRPESIDVVVWPAGNQGLALRATCAVGVRGEFELDGVWPEPLEALVLDDAGRASATRSIRSPHDTPEFALERGPARSGVVLDPRGGPVGGALVESLAAHDGFAVARVAQARSDARGRFKLPFSAPHGLIAVADARWAPTWVTPADSEELRITLTPRRELQVKLIGLESFEGEWTLSGWGIEDVSSASFDGGALRLGGLAPGPYSFALRGPDDATRHFTYVLASSGGGELELRLR